MKRIITFICILIFSLFFNFSYSMADENGTELNNDFLRESKLDNNNDTNNDQNEIPKASIEDIFGDEQAFPFVAGLGKNAAH